ncbi:MAG: bifunctional riboflavin kinase/FAD synthetase [Actinobacteria bacterium]|nr:bifunctional riboflavin kinase/FAD synthetase [Actinomycetota bacterium]
MDVVRDPAERVGHPAGNVVTIGAYDGVHLGHQALLRLVRARADALGAGAALVTFDRHPAQVVRPDSAPRLLTTLEQRIELLENTGLLDLVCVLTFDEERRHETAEEFVEEILVEKLGARAVVVGADFHFGFQRRGNVPFLRDQGERHGFKVEAVDLIPVAESDSGAAYSSTLTRGLLMAGDVDGAARLLGRPHEVAGTVVEGDRRGRDLGFATANVAVPAETCLPAEGIYAGWLLDEGDQVARPAAISLGRRPTFYEEGASSTLLEAHVLDFDGDLYGHRVRVRFAHRLRGEEKFDSAEALVAQIEDDVERTRRITSDSAGE